MIDKKKRIRDQKGREKIHKSEKNVFLRVLPEEVKNGICKPKFWLVVMGFVLILMIDTIPLLYASSFRLENGGWEFGTDIVSLSIQTASGGSYLFWLRFCLYAIPYGCCFLEEYAQGAVKYRLIRSSASSYGITKVLSCVILTAFSVWLSEAIYAVMMSLWGVPLVLPQQSEFDFLSSQYALVAGGHSMAFWLLLSCFKCFAGIYFSLLTLLLSTFIKNRFMLAAMPLTLFFALDSFVGLWFPRDKAIPDLLSWRVIFFHMMSGGVRTELPAFFRTFVYTAVCGVLFGIIFSARIRRVAENE